MNKKLSQIFNSKKLRHSLLGIALVFLLGFGLAQPAMAQINFGQAVLNAILGAVGLIFGVVFNILGTLTGFLLGVAVVIFNWVSSPGFISLSYTNVGLSPGDLNYNNFVGVGWELTRSLTNIVFVIALIAIGIGTALRFSGYQMQKTLPILIGIALLVNFTPVIAGLIIDGSNITMNFFVNPEGSTAGQIIANKSLGIWANIGQLVGGGNKPWDPSGGPQALSAAAASLSLVFFNIIAAIVYLLFAGIFVMRYVMLWTLVILSPFAFACYILPKTRDIFSRWWKYFIQWAIVGIFASFFLYLSEHIYLAVSKAGTFTEITDTASAPGLAPIINSMLPSIIPITLLFVGLIASLSGAPHGAQTILNFGQKTAQRVGQTAAWSTLKTSIATPMAAKRTVQTFIRAKKFGLPTGKAIKEAGKEIKWSIQPKLRSATREPTWRETMGVALKGIRSTIGDIAIKNAVVDIAKSGLGTKKKGKKTKKGFMACPLCGKEIADTAKYCVHCGTNFE